VLAGADSSFTFPRPEITRASTPWQFKNLAIDNQASRLQYEKDFDLDIAQTQVSNDPVFGTSGGAQVAFTDVLGNDQYHLLVYNNARASSDFLKSFNFALTKVSLAKRTNYAYGIFRFAGRYFNYQDLFFYEERYGGFFALSYPLSHFMRLEFSANYSHSDKEWFGFEERKALLASHFVSFVKDNSIWSPSGPIEGERLNLTIGNTFDIRYSNVNYYTLLLDYRHYFRIGLRSAYAVRLMTLMNEGKEARQYYMGGSWDMRGYYRYSLRGQRLALISQEIRFPFIDLLGIQFPFGSIGFNSIRGALFFDAGNAWDEKWEGMLGSFGVGARMRLIGFLVLRVDFGKKTDFKKVSDGIFTQFFFGWDF
jgi:outer membrane protein assembly factor BamA